MEDKLNQIIEKLIQHPSGHYCTKLESNLTDEDKSYLNNFAIHAKSIREKVYLIRHNMDDVPKCKTCGKYLEFKAGYKTYCSNSCSRKNKEVQEKYKKSCINRYGVDNPSKSDLIKEKKTNTHIKNYGTANNFCSEVIRHKAKETINKKYGVDYPTQSKEVQQKIKESNLQKYGVEYLLNSTEIQQKIKETNIRKYGTPNIINDKDFNKKIHNIIREKHNGCGFASNEIKEKIYNTNLERYGVEKIMQLPSMVENVFKIRKQNKTLNTSSLEEYFYNKALKTFKCVKRQYKCNEYPWHCDFYIEDINQFIEIQGYYTHGPHPFNHNNEEDIKLLNKWKQRKYFDAIITWTDKDVEKRNKAKENNLNYIELWNKKDIDEYFEKIK